MKDIKFRVWDGKKMHTPDTFKEVSFREGSGSLFRVWTKNEEFVLLDYSTIEMLYVGANDEDGVEIYEGDVVDCNRYESKETYRVIIKDIRSLPSEMFGSNLNWRRVKGNIHENPELISRQIQPIK